MAQMPEDCICILCNFQFASYETESGILAKKIPYLSLPLDLKVRAYVHMLYKSCNEEHSFWDYSRNTWEMHSRQKAKRKITELSEPITSNFSSLESKRLNF